MNMPGDFILAWPWALLMLPLPLLAWLLLPPRKSNASRALRVPSLSRFQSLQDAHSSWRSQLSSILWLAAVGWLLVVLATARPQWLGEPVNSDVSGRDLMLCIDISESMLAQDMLQGQTLLSRMDVVRSLGSDFIAKRTGDRVGLVLFGEQAYVQTPLTFDHATVQHFLAEAQVGLAGNATAIGDAIGLAVKRLHDRAEEGRVLILITDGANSAGVVGPLEAAQIAKKSDIRIHTIGVGSDPRDRRARSRMPVASLDEAALKQIAQVTGGQYFRARDVSELNRIYATIDQLEPVDSEEQSFRPLTELFSWPLGLALMLSLLACCLHVYRCRV